MQTENRYAPGETVSASIGAARIAAPSIAISPIARAPSRKGTEDAGREQKAQREKKRASTAGLPGAAAEVAGALRHVSGSAWGVLRPLAEHHPQIRAGRTLPVR